MVGSLYPKVDQNAMNALIKKNINTVVTTSDGTTYFPGGIMVNGKSLSVYMYTMRQINDFNKFKLSLTDENTFQNCPINYLKLSEKEGIVLRLRKSKNYIEIFDEKSNIAIAQFNHISLLNYLINKF